MNKERTKYEIKEFIKEFINTIMFVSTMLFFGGSLLIFMKANIILISELPMVFKLAIPLGVLNILILIGNKIPLILRTKEDEEIEWMKNRK